MDFITFVEFGIHGIDLPQIPKAYINQKLLSCLAGDVSQCRYTLGLGVDTGCSDIDCGINIWCTPDKGRISTTRVSVDLHHMLFFKL